MKEQTLAILNMHLNEAIKRSLELVSNQRYADRNSHSAVRLYKYGDNLKLLRSSQLIY